MCFVWPELCLAALKLLGGGDALENVARARRIPLLENGDLGWRDITVMGRGCVGFQRTVVSICTACGGSVLLRFLDIGVSGVCVRVHGRAWQ